MEFASEAEDLPRSEAAGHRCPGSARVCRVNHVVVDRRQGRPVDTLTETGTEPAETLRHRLVGRVVFDPGVLDQVNVVGSVEATAVAVLIEVSGWINPSSMAVWTVVP